MEYLLICIAALLASALTLFSGFGLGTLLLPAFLIFFPADIAVSMTAIVHLLNNALKLVLLGRNADRGVLLRFGVPAVFASFAGAWVLVAASDLAPLATYEIGGRAFEVQPVKVLMGALIIGFAVLEALPKQPEFGRQYLPLGGALSGFFGGLSGHQGALRSAFLVRAGLSKEAFIATGVAIACLVDVTRLGVYGRHVALAGLREHTGILAAAVAAAFAGAAIGARLVTKVTMKTIRRIVAVLLVLIGAGLLTGLL